MRNKRSKEVEAKKKIKRTVLFTLGVLILIYLGVSLVFGESGLIRYIKLKAMRAEIQAEIAGLKKRNEEIRRQIEARKKDPNLVEELARKQGLTREDELIFKFEDDE